MEVIVLMYTIKLSFLALFVHCLIKSGSKTRLGLEKASEDTLEYLGSFWAPSSGLCALRCPELTEYWRELYKYDEVSQRCDCLRNSNSFVHAPTVLPLRTRIKFVYKSRFRLFLSSTLFDVIYTCFDDVDMVYSGFSFLDSNYPCFHFKFRRNYSNF